MYQLCTNFIRCRMAAGWLYSANNGAKPLDQARKKTVWVEMRNY